MHNINFFVILEILCWIYMLTVFYRGKLKFQFFITGSVGCFIFYMILLQPVLTVKMQQIVATMAGVLGEITGIYKGYVRHSILFIQTHGESISMFIDYECSGFIEIGAFASLLLFFPVYRFYEKIVVLIRGCLLIMLFNVARIYLIAALIYFYGIPIYFVAHTVIGRIFFYICSVVLYFHTFTKTQIERQKVGNVSYESIDESI